MLKEFDLYNQIALITVIVGGILWGLAGLFNVYLIIGIFGVLFGRIIYILVGIAAGWLCYQIYLEKTKKIL